MDRNFALALGLSFLVLMLWTMFTESQRPPEPPLPPPGATEVGEREALEEEIAAPVFPEPGVVEEAPLLGEAPIAEEPDEQTVEVQSTLYDAEFTTHGGGLLRWRLKEYNVGEEHGGLPVDLVTFDPNRKPSLATPFDELGFGDLSRSAYTFEQPDSSTLVFTREQGGIHIRKTYLFQEKRYLFRLMLEVENRSDRQIRVTFRTRWPAMIREETGFQNYSLVARADGSLEQAPVGSGPSMLGIFGGSRFEEPREFPSEVDWAGAQSRYFLAALIPDVPRDAGTLFTPLEPGVEAMTEMAFQAVNIPPGQRAERELAGLPRSQDPGAAGSRGRPSRRGDPQGLVPGADSLLHLAAGSHVFGGSELRRGDHHRDHHGATPDGTGDGPADEVDEEDGRAAAQDERGPGEIRATIARSSPRR